MNEMKRIELRLTARGWVARWSGPDRDEIVSAMGSDTVPTPYLRGYEPSKMVEEISARNPGYVVVVAK